MSFHDHLRRIYSFTGPRKSSRRSIKAGRRLQLENLEDRMVPTILFTPQFGNEAMQLNLPSNLLNNQTPVFLIFWGGAEFADGQGNPNATAIQFEQAASNVFPGPYLSALGHYDPLLGNATIQGFVVDTSEPGPTFSLSRLIEVVDNATDNLGVPEVDDIAGKTPLYVVITPNGTLSDQVPSNGGEVTGYHITEDLGGFGDADSSPLVWVGMNHGVDSATVTLSHEIAEATTDPDPLNPAFTTTPGAMWTGPVSSISEVADNEAENFTYRLNGTLVQSYAWDPSWPNSNSVPLYIVPDGNVQAFLVSAGTLIVNGDQLTSKDDQIAVDLSPQGGVTVNLNGESATFDPGAINSIVVNTLTGTNHVTVNACNVPVKVVTLTGTNFVSVEGADAPVTINTLGGTNTVTVAACKAPVNINDGSNDVVNIGDPSVGLVKDIKAPVTLNNPAHLTELAVYNWADTGGAVATITSSQISGLGTINYLGSQLAGLIIYGGHGTCSYSVESTPGSPALERGVPVTLNLGEILSVSGFGPAPGGQDTVYVGGPSHTLDGIRGPLTINGQFGTTDLLYLNDYGANAGHNYVCNNSMLSRSGAQMISYHGVELVLIKAASNYSDTFTVTQAAPANMDLMLYGGSLGNSLTGPNVANTWQIQGPNGGILDGYVHFVNMQNLTGGSSSDAFEFVGSSASVSGKVDGGAGTPNSLSYEFNGGAGVNVSLASVSAGVASDIGLGFTNIDSLVGSNASIDTFTAPNGTTNDWSISGNSVGNLVVVGSPGKFSFEKVERLVGGSGVDTFKFSPGATIPYINGGSLGGGNWLDYSSFLSPVTVNLTTGFAIGALAGVGNIQNVLGGAGNDTLTGGPLGSILIGGGGHNTLAGAGGVNLLIGGTGSASITAGSDGDILIGGWTDYDAGTDLNRIALAAIMKEWRSVKPGTPAQGYSTKVGDLLFGGGLNQNYKLNGSTVHASAAQNSLIGGPGLDWYFAHSGDSINGKLINGQSAGEQVYWI